MRKKVPKPYVRPPDKKMLAIEAFLKELCTRFNRTEQDLLKRGLKSEDFDSQVKLQIGKGSFIHYEKAFLLKNEEKVGVFTCDAGYHLFSHYDFEDYIEEKMI